MLVGNHLYVANVEDLRGRVGRAKCFNNAVLTDSSYSEWRAQCDSFDNSSVSSTAGHSRINPRMHLPCVISIKPS